MADLPELRRSRSGRGALQSFTTGFSKPQAWPPYLLLLIGQPTGLACQPTSPYTSTPNTYTPSSNPCHLEQNQVTPEWVRFVGEHKGGSRGVAHPSYCLLQPHPPTSGEVRGPMTSSPEEHALMSHAGQGQAEGFQEIIYTNVPPSAGSGCGCACVGLWHSAFASVCGYAPAWLVYVCDPALSHNVTALDGVMMLLCTKGHSRVEDEAPCWRATTAFYALVPNPVPL